MKKVRIFLIMLLFVSHFNMKANTTRVVRVATATIIISSGLGMGALGFNEIINACVSKWKYNKDMNSHIAKGSLIFIGGVCLTFVGYYYVWPKFK